MNPGIVVALVAAAASCFFAAANTALKTFSRAKLIERLEGRRKQDRLEPFLAQFDDLLLMTGMIRSCLNFVVVLAALYTVESTTEAFRPSRPVQYMAAFIAAGALVSVLGVAIPNALARYHPEALLVQSMDLLGLLRLLFNPLAKLLRGFDPIIRRLSGVDLRRQADNPMSDEVLSVVEEHESQGNVDQVQKEMIQAVFEFPTTTAGQIMTPRTDVQALPLNSTLDQVKEAALKFGHSRIPVYDGSVDHVVGILYAKDLIAFLGEARPFELKPVLREALMVPESKPVRELLAEFKARKVHIAIILDEYGGTAGLATIEDIIEELVGEIHDEYERTTEKPSIRQVDPRTAEVDARMHIDDLNRELDLALPEAEDYDTLGGFVFSHLGHIPRVGESFNVGAVRLIVVDAERTRVNRVRIERPETPAGGEDGPAA